MINQNKTTRKATVVPWGILNHLFTVHTMNRETLRNDQPEQNHKMTPRQPHRPPRKHSELKEPDEILKKTKTLTTIARQKTAKEKALQ